MSGARYWWERIPGLLHYELDELDRIGARYRVSEAAQRRGQIRIELTYPVDGREVELTAVYPDSYPYFRPELFANSERLEHHQHPFRKNLCLMGRATSNWSTEDTLAGIIEEQLDLVFQTGRATHRDAVIGLEEEQAEPFSEYYGYAPAMVLVDGSWEVDRRYRFGDLVLATQSIGRAALPLVQAAVMEMTDNRGKVVQRAPVEWRRAFSGREILGKWWRVEHPVMEDGAAGIVARAARAGVHAPEQTINGWRLKVLGVLFREETAHRQNGDGWVFACQAVDAIAHPGVRPLERRSRGSRLRQRTGTQR